MHGNHIPVTQRDKNPSKKSRKSDFSRLIPSSLVLWEKDTEQGFGKAEFVEEAAGSGLVLPALFPVFSEGSFPWEEAREEAWEGLPQVHGMSRDLFRLLMDRSAGKEPFPAATGSREGILVEHDPQGIFSLWNSWKLWGLASGCRSGFGGIGAEFWEQA